VRSIRLLIALVAFALVVAACGGDEAEDTTTSAAVTTLPPVTETTTSSTTTSTTTTTTLATGPPSLLNGLSTPVGADAERRVIAVKVDNHPDARPQSGIQDADAMIELLVEGGITRFIALFHTSDTDYIGPIRSGRPTDPTLIRPLEATFQISGAQGWVQSLIRARGVDFMGETRPNTFRIPRGSRAYERTLYGDTEAMRGVADDRGYPDDPPAGPWFAFGDPGTPTDVAEEVALSWSSDWAAVRWVWDGEQYTRFNGDTAHEWVDAEGEGEQITTDTLLVLMARRYTASPGSGQSGSSVPALETTGTGDAYLFFDGSVIEGTWEREEVEDYFTVTKADGSEMMLPPGRLWVSVFPDNRPVTWQ
jgi:hypothetical protein